ncbi:MAG: substrate-binding domain-containing protein, partial [Pirellulales bacterium]
MIRTVRRLWMLAIVALLLAGCTRSESAPEATTNGEKRFRIAVIPKGTTHVFWKSVHAGALRAAEELGNVDIHWKGALLENDREGQINVVADFVAQGVDGIVLAPLDATALVPSVDDAKREGIPTVIFDSGLA